MDRQKLIAKIDACKSDMRDLDAKLNEAIRDGGENLRANRIWAAKRYQQIELNRMARELADMDSVSVLE